MNSTPPIFFKDWLPDGPDFQNPGLTEAKNTLPYDGTYKSFAPLTAVASSTLGAQPVGAYYAATKSATTAVSISNVAAVTFNGLPASAVEITTSTTHGLSSGDIVEIGNIVASGNIQVNGVWAVNAVSNSTTFQIGATPEPNRYGGTYSSGGTVSRTHSVSIYAGTSTDLYALENGAWTKRSASTYTSATHWEFCVYKDNVLATNGKDAPQVQTSQLSNFLTLATAGSAPVANALGIVGQFVMLGDTSDGEYYVQWSGVDAPRSWPTPGSTTATAQQSGQQALKRNLGPVCMIHGMDQSGVILQRSGVTRVTYVGGDVVFQFDTISEAHGAFCRYAAVQVDRIVYFVSAQGFFATDGVQIVPIGDGKVDRYFLNNLNLGYKDLIRGAHVPRLKLIYWAWPSTAAGDNQMDSLLIYNYAEKRWTHAAQGCDLIFTRAATDTGADAYGFDANHCLATFSGTPGTATFATGEAEPNPGEYTYISGIKALADATAAAISGSILYRNDLQASVTTANALTANSRTGYMDIRQNARYVRTQIAITGTFNAAQGIELKIAPGGMA